MLVDQAIEDFCFAEIAIIKSGILMNNFRS